MPEPEWELPPPLLLHLDLQELQLIDWSICAASRMLPDCALEQLMAWHNFRMDVWTGILFSEKANKPAAFAISEQEAKILLAVVPTTFRWSTEVHCGYSLEAKLAKFLRGEHDDSDNQDASAAADPAKDNTTD